MAESVKTVPWDYQENALGETWEWNTAHFNARIQTDQGRYSWIIKDKTQGRLRSLDAGVETTHQNADDKVREIIGKSYPAKYGYRAYAGRLATTFRIYTGQEVDFFDMETTKVVVSIKMPENQQRSFTGTLRVVHHKIHITTEGNQTYAIDPSHIIEAHQEFGKYSTSAASQQQVKTKRVETATSWLFEG